MEKYVTCPTLKLKVSTTSRSIMRPVVRGAPQCSAGGGTDKRCRRWSANASPSSADPQIQSQRVAPQVLLDVAQLSRRSVFGLSRRIGMLGGVLALTAGPSVSVSKASASGVRSLVFSGQERFQKGDVDGSLQDFDQALQMDPTVKPYLWQRGLSLYYADRFSDGLEQFTNDVKVNPNDTEESIWAFLCEAQLNGFESARSNMLTVGRDRRPIMRSAYDTFQHADTPEQLLALGERSRPGGGSDSFYSKLYAAMFYEAKGDVDAARVNMVGAVRTPYAQRSGDYMANLAMVHCQLRGWGVEQ